MCVEKSKVVIKEKVRRIGDWFSWFINFSFSSGSLPLVH